MEVSQMLKKAWAAVEDAGLPTEIREAAFREAMRVLAPAPGPAPAAVPQARTPGGASGSRPGAKATGNEVASNDHSVDVSEEEVFEKVAAQTGVDRKKLEEMVHFDGDALKVSIPGIKLGRNNAEKTRAVAQILTIVRGFGLDEAGTPVEEVRVEANRLKCYDSANFSAQLNKLSGYVITGSGANRRIRAKAAGIQAFPAFVDALLGES